MGQKSFKKCEIGILRKKILITFPHCRQYPHKFETVWKSNTFTYYCEQVGYGESV